MIHREEGLAYKTMVGPSESFSFPLHFSLILTRDKVDSNTMHRLTILAWNKILH